MFAHRAAKAFREEKWGGWISYSSWQFIKRFSLICCVDLLLSITGTVYYVITSPGAPRLSFVEDLNWVRDYKMQKLSSETTAS